MKKILSTIGAGFAYAFGTLIFIALLPVILGLIVIFGTPSAYEWLWSKIRRDPRRNLKIAELQDKTWETADTEEAFAQSFARLCGTIANLSGAKQGKVVYGKSGAPVKKFQKADWTLPDDKIPEGHKSGWTDLSLSQSLESKHATINISLEFGTFFSEDGERHVDMTDGDDQDHTAFPPVTVDIILPRLQTKRRFTLVSSESVWVVISFLRGNIKFEQPSGQLWAHIPEHEVWLVEYKANEPGYGQRLNFNNAVARKYGKDQAPTLY